jgi:hypothetical protein
MGSWPKVTGLDVAWEVVGYGAEGQRGFGTDPRRRPRALPAPRDASTCSHYVTRKSVVLVDDGGGGFLIHGWPPCNGRRCIVVTHGWEGLLTALAKEGGGSIRVVA